MFEIGLFWEESFPAEDAPPPNLDALRRALDGFDVRVLGYSDLEHLPSVDLFVLPFGSAFPASGWPLIQVFLRNGGNLLNLGGMPFTVPCARRHVLWKAQTRAVSYLREIGIRQAHPIDAGRVASLMVPPDAPILTGVQQSVRARALFALMPDADDEASRRADPGDCIIRPLLYGLDGSGRPVAAPVVAIGHTGGAFRGGRWVFATLDGALSPDAIRRLAFFAAAGASDLTVTPSFPSYYPGEVPRLEVHASLLGPTRGTTRAAMTITDPQGNRATCELEPIPFGDRPAYRWSECDGSLFGSSPLAPGFYEVEARLVGEGLGDLAARLGLPPAAQGGVRAHRSGFWVWDASLMRADPDGPTDGPESLPSPLLGASYAAALPANARRWDADLRLMRDTGFGMVRLAPPAGAGAPNEASFRAVDALLLSARRYGLRVSLDTGALAGRMAPCPDGRSRAHESGPKADLFAPLLARYQDVPGIIWEFTDNPDALEAAGDTGIEAAWQEWLAVRGTEELRAQWRLTHSDSLALPSEPAGGQDGAPGRALELLDYQLFARERSASRLNAVRESLRSHSSASRLLAVSPDGQSPAWVLPSQGAADLAYSAPVRGEDDLIPTAALTGGGTRRSLITLSPGLLSEDPDGDLRTGEEEIRSRLERMLAMAIAAGAAGGVCCPWKPGRAGASGYSAGLVRADGAATPALDGAAAFAAFLDRNRQRLHGREREAVAVVVPASRILTQPDLAEQAVAACLRTLHGHTRVPARAVSEYDLEGLEDARLLILPSPRVLRQEAWEALLARVHEGAVLLATGPVDLDAYWRPLDRLSQFGLRVHTRPVAREETVSLYGENVRLRFGGEKPYRVDKAVIEGCPAQVMALPHGKGRLLFAPLPFELADDESPLVELYDLAITESGVERVFAMEPRHPGVWALPLVLQDTVLYALVSQSDGDQSVALLHGPERVPIPVVVPAGRAVLLMVERATGAVLDRCAPPVR